MSIERDERCGKRYTSFLKSFCKGMLIKKKRERQFSAKKLSRPLAIFTENEQFSRSHPFKNDRCTAIKESQEVNK